MNLIFLRDHRLDVSKVLVFICSIALVVVWFVFRHQSWIWIIQNLMALSLAINALSYYRLNSYKTIIIILTLFFLYDIFMVFVTPTFTNGASIMASFFFFFQIILIKFLIIKYLIQIGGRCFWWQRWGVEWTSRLEQCSIWQTTRQQKQSKYLSFLRFKIFFFSFKLIQINL